MAQWSSAFNGSSGGSYRLVVNVDVVGQEPSNNRTLIRYSAWIDKVAGSGFWNFDATSGSTNINGYIPGRSWGSYDFRSYSRRYIAQDEDYWVGHDGNGDANPYFSAYWHLDNGSALTDSSAGGNVWMPHINRYANITGYSVTNITDVGFNINVNTDAVCDIMWYSLDNGGSWISVGGDFTSKTVPVTNLRSDVTYQVKVRIRRKDSGLTTDSGAWAATTLPQGNFLPFFIMNT